eukprot:CAMPEP_0119302594 /NCGR_PEP_ID=MMETSP1333-20130426/4168_1 /TAXON_ID=418940 /ORGANISM="Scyphosphaera apsteinii, Strain RCC1455" /LENGTH=544 /DNA_ID=CAMNT_0007304995 /DNA_START=178 /DNA_END=1812 /DNA_ORIENTATION=-
MGMRKRSIVDGPSQESACIPSESWVSSQLAALLQTYPAGATNAIIACDLQRRWIRNQSSRSKGSWIGNLARAVENSRVDSTNWLQCELRSTGNVFELAACGGAEGHVLKHLPDPRLLQPSLNEIMRIGRQLHVIGGTLAPISGTTHLLPTSLCVPVLEPLRSEADLKLVENARLAWASISTQTPTALVARVHAILAGQVGAQAVQRLLLAEDNPGAEPSAELWLFEEAAQLSQLVQTASLLCIHHPEQCAGAHQPLANLTGRTIFSFGTHTVLCLVAPAQRVHALPHSAGSREDETSSTTFIGRLSSLPRVSSSGDAIIRLQPVDSAAEVEFQLDSRSMAGLEIFAGAHVFVSGLTDVNSLLSSESSKPNDDSPPAVQPTRMLRLAEGTACVSVLSMLHSILHSPNLYKVTPLPSSMDALHASVIVTRAAAVAWSPASSDGSLVCSSDNGCGSPFSGCANVHSLKFSILLTLDDGVSACVCLCTSQAAERLLGTTPLNFSNLTLGQQHRLLNSVLVVDRLWALTGHNNEGKWRINTCATCCDAG